MKKNLIFFLLIFSFFMLFSCNSPVEKSSSNYVIMVPSSNGQNVEVKLRIDFSGVKSANYRNPGDWSGILKVSGEGINGTYQVNIYRNMVANGMITLMLPLGNKNFQMEINYERNDGKIDVYEGSTSGNVATGVNNFNLTLRQKIQNGVAEISGENERYFYITLIAKNSGNNITGAVLKFEIDGKQREFTIDKPFYQFYLPVQGEQVDNINTPYTYTITHPNYLPLTGTLKISMNEIELDGVVLSNEYEYTNIIKKMDDDIYPPEIIIENVPSEIYDNFTLDFQINDNVKLSNVIFKQNGVNLLPEINGNHYIYNIVYKSLNIGINNFYLEAIDASGNKAIREYTISKVDNINPTILSESVPTEVHDTNSSFNISFTLNDNDKINSAKIVINDGANLNLINNGNIYNLNINISQLNYGANTLKLVVSDIAGNTISKNYIVTKLDKTPPVIKNFSCPSRVIVGYDFYVSFNAYDNNNFIANIFSSPNYYSINNNNNFFELTYSTIDYGIGLLNLIIRVYDNYGNYCEVSKKISVIVDMLP